MIATTRRRSAASSPAFDHLGKPHGILSPRVRAVGPEHFGIVAVDCAKASSKVLHSTVPPAKQAGEASRRGKDAFLDQFPPEPNTMIEIVLQDADGGTTVRRQPHQHRPIPAEMTRPLMTAGIEQRNDFSGLGIDAGDVRPFVAVACEAA